MVITVEDFSEKSDPSSSPAASQKSPAISERAIPLPAPPEKSPAAPIPLPAPASNRSDIINTVEECDEDDGPTSEEAMVVNGDHDNRPANEDGDSQARASILLANENRKKAYEELIKFNDENEIDVELLRYHISYHALIF